jgi:hypothetical protein
VPTTARTSADRERYPDMDMGVPFRVWRSQKR